MDHIKNWLEGIPREEFAALQHTPEYHAFMNAFKHLEIAHQAQVSNEREIPSTYGSASILSYISDDDVLLRICEWLECFPLVTLSETCSRFHLLCNLSAKQRVKYMDGKFYLDSYMKLLRAKEQTEGIVPDELSVRVPFLGLERRVVVTDAGDDDFNGIYHCIGSNGNGFIFSKPRFYKLNLSSVHFQVEENIENENGLHRRRRRRIDNEHQNPAIPISATAQEEEIFPETKDRQSFLKCFICKKFSNQTILWYMSKEVDETNDGEISQEFYFWANLMVSGQGNPDICRYPSQTSRLSRDGSPAWMPLGNNQTMNPPIVELLD